MAEPLVDVRGLERRYRRTVAVAGVTLRVDPGAVVGLVGANGGGKTTTLRMLAGLIRPDSGDGEVLGEAVRRAGAARNGRIGYMAQRLSLYGELTVAENLRFHADVHGLARPRDRVAVSVATYGLGDHADRRVDRLSGGWARRAQFAAAVIHAPALLLLDEPTAGLDIATRAAIWRAIAAFAAEGRGVVVSTHDLLEAEGCASVVPFHGGRALAQTSPTALARLLGAETLADAVVAMATGAAEPVL